MTEFTVLGIVRSHLAEHMGEEAIVFGNPEEENDSIKCFLELEEIWTSIKNSQNAVQARLKFKTTCVSPGIGLREGLDFAEKIKQLLEGQSFKLADERTATLRAVGGKSVYRHGQDKKIVTQCYESLIRR